MMDSVTLENFRCFRERQTVRLAPLTLLVGENSTGKTSFLAMLRALHQLAYTTHIPTFKEPPYDLGSFDEITHRPHDSSRTRRPFKAGFHATAYRGLGGSLIEQPHCFRVRFGRSGAASLPTARQWSFGDVSIKASRRSTNQKYEHIEMTTARGKWGTLNVHPPQTGTPDALLLTVQIVLSRHDAGVRDDEPLTLVPIDDSPDISDEDKEALRRLTTLALGAAGPSPFAGAPIRSQPQRTYDPAPPTQDAEGSYIPLYFNDLRLRDHKAWDDLRNDLRSFGRDAQLFSELSIDPFGSKPNNPFQLRVRTVNDSGGASLRNISDVGYGVSQVVPVITEILRPDAPALHLLQQPEVHLHPSAQAALGTLFCEVAAEGRQLIVETHSDHLMDRVRMDVRDGTTGLKPEDVSLLYFERNGLDVCIRPLRFDRLGNVLDAPRGYRRFFLEEVNRSLGF